MLHAYFHHGLTTQSTSVHVYTKYINYPGSVSKQQCFLSSSSLPYLVHFFTTYIILIVGRGAGGSWATAMVVTVGCSNPVEGLEVEQHDVILVIDCVSQLFLMSVDLEDLPIAAIPFFRCIKTVFIASSTRTGVLRTLGSTATKPLPTFSCKIQTNQVTYSNFTITFCTKDLEYIFAAAVPLIPSHVQPRTSAVSAASSSG